MELSNDKLMSRTEGRDGLTAAPFRLSHYSSSGARLQSHSSEPVTLMAGVDKGQFTGIGARRVASAAVATRPAG